MRCCIEAVTSRTPFGDAGERRLFRSLRSSRGVGVWGPALLLALASCARSEPAPQDASTKRGAEQRLSAKLGYSWTLPPGWEFVPLEALGVQPDKLSIDTFAA